jgi:hypothetical protein
MAEEFDLRGHRGTYAAFTKLLTYATVGIVILLILMGIFLA